METAFRSEERFTHKLRITIDDVFADVDAVEPNRDASRRGAQTRRSRPAQ